MDFGFSSITDLAKMLNEVDRNEDSDSEDEPCSSKSANQGPGDIAQKSKSAVVPPTSSTSSDNSEKIKPQNEIKSKPNEIWDLDYVAKAVNQGDGDKEDDFGINNISIHNDPRQTPTYEIHYRQSVTTEDVFLQMGNKTSGTASCENLVVEIHLPQDNLENIHLNLKKQAIDLRSPIHFLYLNLPHPIDPRAGNAKWDKEKEKLVITLHLIREFDEFNF